MASSDIDELDGYKPTTPYRPPPSKKRAAASKPAMSQTRAGPSGAKLAPKSTSRKASSPTRVVELEDDNGVEEAEIEEIMDDDTTSTRPDAIVVNGTGRGATKGKGKTKEVPSKRPASPVVIEASSDDNNRATGTGAGKGKKLASRLAPTSAASTREVERLRKQLEEVTAQRDDLDSQVRELTDLRLKEPEVELQATAAQYEAALAVKEQLYQAAVEELARCQPLLPSGHSSLVHFLTREEANAEKRALQGLLDEARTLASQRDDRIKELEAELTLVKQERDAEIRRAKELQTAAGARGGTSSGALATGKSGDNSQDSSTIDLYEALTHVVVLNAKSEPGLNPSKQDCSYSCYYAHGPHSLSFLLECKWQLGDDEDPQNAQLFCMDRFSPQHLDKEPDAFIKRLNYLAGSISFSHDQVDILFRDLHSFMIGPDPEEDDTVEVVN